MAKGKIFISYRRSDSGFASVAIKNLLLYRYLHEDQIFMDLDSIRPGEPFPAKLDEALNACSVVVAIIGPDWLSEIQKRLQNPNEEDFVRLELATSLARNTPIIPVVLDGTQMPGPRDLPTDLQALCEKNAVDIGYRKFDSDIAKLVKGLRLYGVESTRPPPTIASPAREQREVSILIAHVQGLDALYKAHPGEAGETLLSACMAGLDGAILDQDGFVSRDTGSRITGFFGTPDAHDDDPDRACLAALQMRSFLSHFVQENALGDNVILTLCAGIDVGRVTSGHVGPKGTFGIVGQAGVMADTLNVQAAASEILVSNGIATRCADRFAFDASREIQLAQGQTIDAQSLTATAIDDASDVTSGLVGRDEERDALQKRLGDADTHPWIEISGAMGVGKTRLVRASIDTHDAEVIHVAASRLACQRPLGFIRQLMDACMRSFSSNPNWAADLDTFETALETLGPDVEIFAEVLWPFVAPEGTYDAPREDPATRRRRAERGLTVFLEGLGTRREHLLWLDGYDLVDEESASILESIAQTDVPEDVQFVITRRPGDRAPVFPDSLVTLEGLPHDDARLLLNLHLKGATLPDPIQEELLQRAEGVPLFIEEMVQSMRYEAALSGPATGPWTYTPVTQAGQTPLPASIRAAMTTRLDRLSDEAGRVLSEASVQGAEFQPEVIRRLHKKIDTDGDDNSVDAIFAELQQQGLVEVLHAGDGDMLAFCNPIMEDVCYERLVASDRKALHQKTAELLCDIAGGETNVAPDTLAHHFDAAEIWERAFHAHICAGNAAADLFANTRARNDYTAALQAAEKVSGSTGDVNRLKAGAHERLATLHLRLGNYGDALSHADALCETAPSSRELAEGFRMRALATRYKGDIERAEELFEEAIAKAGGDGDVRDVQIRIILDFAEFLYHENRPAEALRMIERMQAVSTDCAAATRMQINLLAGKITRGLGRFDDSKQLFDEAYRDAMMDGTKTEIAKALINRGILERDLGNYRRSEKHFVKALELWKQVGDEEWMAGSCLNIGMVALSIGEYAKALDRFTEARETFSHMGNVERVALAEANFALLYLEQAKPQQALEAAETALLMIGNTRGWLRGLVQQVRGEAHLQLRNVDDASDDFDAALAEFKPEDHPEVAAGCIRGQGRVAFKRGYVEEALEKLSDAAKRFETLHRNQEAGRTLADIGQVCCKLGHVDEAADAYRKAIALLESIKVPNDVQRVQRMLSVLPTDDSEPCPEASTGEPTET